MLNNSHQRLTRSDGKRVLLLNPPGEHLFLRDQYCSSISKAAYYWPPIDLIFLSGYLSEHHQVHAIDAIIGRMSRRACMRAIEEWAPDVVIFLTGVASWPADLEFMAEVKARTEATTIGVGGVLLYEGHRILPQNEHLDAIILDFCTDNFLAVIEDRAEGVINNLIYRGTDGQIYQGERRAPKQFTVPAPRHELFDLARYRLPHGRRQPLTSVMTSDGCPWTCSYCVASPLKYRYRPVENIIEEFTHLHNLGVKEMFFKDFTFGVRKDLAIEMCRQMVERKLDLTWVCASRVDTVDEELLEAMARAGCHTIQFGVETADEELLKLYRKRQTHDDTMRVFEMCRAVGIRTLAHFILGLPGETKESILRTVEYAKELQCDFASFNIVIPQVGTDLRKMTIEKGYYDPSMELTFDSGQSYPVIETELLSKDDLWEYRNRAVRSFYLDPAYLWRRASGIRTATELRNLVTNGAALLTGKRSWITTD